MKTKNIAMLALLSTLITSAPCFAAKDNPITSIITGNLARARNWTYNFMYRCRNVGILATLYATVGIYDVKKISGLDAENTEELKKYNDLAQLEAAKKRVEIMLEYGIESKKLNKFYSEIQGRIDQIISDKKAADKQKKEEEDLEYTTKI